MRSEVVLPLSLKARKLSGINRLAKVCPLHLPALPIHRQAAFQDMLCGQPVFLQIV